MQRDNDSDECEPSGRRPAPGLHAVAPARATAAAPVTLARAHGGNGPGHDSDVDNEEDAAGAEIGRTRSDVTEVGNLHFRLDDLDTTSPELPEVCGPLDGRDPNADPEADAALVGRAQAGDAGAFAKLYHRHVRYVAGVLYRLMRNEQDVDDLIQDAFADAYAHIRRLRDPARFRSWIARIAVCAAYDRMAARRRRNWLTSVLRPFRPKSSDPALLSEVDALYRALERIAPDRRIPWVLHVLEGERLEEVARLCGCSLATVKRRIAEASEYVTRALYA